MERSSSFHEIPPNAANNPLESPELPRRKLSVDLARINQGISIDLTPEDERVREFGKTLESVVVEIPKEGDLTHLKQIIKASPVNKDDDRSTSPVRRVMVGFASKGVVIHESTTDASAKECK